MAETPLYLTRQHMADHYIDMIRKPKPELGWSGDPFLVLAFHEIENRWELWRNEPERNNPDRHVMVARGPIGQDLNEQAVVLLIRHLVEIDTHRSGNSAEAQLEKVMRKNAELDRQREAEFVDQTADALGKFYYEAGKTLGVTKTDFYFPDA